MSRKRTPPPSSRRRSRLIIWLGLGLGLVLAAGALAGAGYLVGQAWQRAQTGETDVASDYPAALTRAADALSGATYRFTVEQLRVSNATPTASGSQAPSANPEPSVSSSPTPGDEGVVTDRFVGAGAFDGARFWQAVYILPLDVPTSDYASGTLGFAYITTPGETAWRDDGAGWFKYGGIIPGEGFDPLSAAHLPDLLRHLVDVKPETADTAHAGLTGYLGQLDPIDYPGVITADGLLHTGAPLTIIVWLDKQERLVRLEATASNLNVPEDVLVSLFLEYGDPGPAPVPSPLASLGPAAPPGPTPAPVPSVRP